MRCQRARRCDYFPAFKRHPTAKRDMAGRYDFRAKISARWHDAAGFLLQPTTLLSLQRRISVHPRGENHREWKACRRENIKKTGNHSSSRRNRANCLPAGLKLADTDLLICRLFCSRKYCCKTDRTYPGRRRIIKTKHFNQNKDSESPCLLIPIFGSCFLCRMQGWVRTGCRRRENGGIQQYATGHGFFYRRISRAGDLCVVAHTVGWLRAGGTSHR